MTAPISVDEILDRVPLRAQVAYTYLLTHTETNFDQVTGWSYALMGQDDLATEMECSPTTVKRALADLRGVGLVRVLAWPGARTETHVRVADVSVDSVFGPVQSLRDGMHRGMQVDLAIGLLIRQWNEFEAEIRVARERATDPACGLATDPSTDTSSACMCMHVCVCAGSKSES
jgi:hypothetical protein